MCTVFKPIHIVSSAKLRLESSFNVPFLLGCFLFVQIEKLEGGSLVSWNEYDLEGYVKWHAHD